MVFENTDVIDFNDSNCDSDESRKRTTKFPESKRAKRMKKNTNYNSVSDNNNEKSLNRVVGCVDSSDIDFDDESEDEISEYVNCNHDSCSIITESLDQYLEQQFESIDKSGESSGIRARLSLKSKDWNSLYNALLKYGEGTGNYNVPVYGQLWNWLQCQRRLKSSGGLRPKREKLLQSLVDQGKLSWDIKRNDNIRWNRMFELLIDYGKEHDGDCNIPTTCRSHMEVASWLHHQRLLKLEGRLGSFRLKKLQDLVDNRMLLWTFAKSNWDQMYIALLKYGEDHNGDCNVPNGYIVTTDTGLELKLGEWLRLQFQHRALQNGLRKNREKRLQDLIDQGRLNLYLDGDEVPWDTMYSALSEYSNKHGGTCNMSYEYIATLIDGQRVELGVWLYKQRNLKRAGLLDAARVAKLQALVDEGKLNWRKLKPSHSKWNRMMEALVAYGEEHNGDCNVSRRCVATTIDGTKLDLGTWLHTQRFRKAHANLSVGREQRLQILVDAGKLDWVEKSTSAPPLPDVVHSGDTANSDYQATEETEGQNDATWRSSMSVLEQYGQEHNGDCDVPRNAIYFLSDGSTCKLGHWLQTQRQLKVGIGGELSTERKRRLEELVDRGQLSWEPENVNDRWFRMFSALVQFGKEHNGNCNVPFAYSCIMTDGSKVCLGKWLHTQRQLYWGVGGELLPDRLNRLQELVSQRAFIWDI